MNDLEKVLADKSNLEFDIYLEDTSTKDIRADIESLLNQALPKKFKDKFSFIAKGFSPTTGAQYSVKQCLPAMEDDGYGVFKSIPVLGWRGRRNPIVAYLNQWSDMGEPVWRSRETGEIFENITYWEFLPLHP